VFGRCVSQEFAATIHTTGGTTAGQSWWRGWASKFRLVKPDADKKGAPRKLTKREMEFLHKVNKRFGCKFACCLFVGSRHGARAAHQE